MILTKDLLASSSKSAKKGRLEAHSILSRLAKAAGLPEPAYHYEARGSTKKRLHFMKVRYRVPDYLWKAIADEKGNGHGHWWADTGGNFHVSGAGKATSKEYAKSLAALEVIHRIEEELGLERDELRKRLDEFCNISIEKQKAIKEIPVEEPMPELDWATVPIDTSFNGNVPATREGRIEFSSYLKDSPEAFNIAKALTLSCHSTLPKYTIHVSHTDVGIDMQQWANIKSESDLIPNFEGQLGEQSMGADRETAILLALQGLYIRTLTSKEHLLNWVKESNRIKRKKRNVAHKRNKRVKPGKSFDTFLKETEALGTQRIKDDNRRLLLDILIRRKGDLKSFGMAKLMVNWPKHHLADVRALVQLHDQEKERQRQNIINTRTTTSELQEHRANHPPQILQPSHQDTQQQQQQRQQQGRQELNQRIQTFRMHQQTTPLPIDEIETKIPHDKDVIILCGGTGSGKTTRFPIMVSLFGPSRVLSNHSNTSHMIVAQPRRLACQATARRVAYEQGYHVTDKQSPVGYSIRFESFPANRQLHIHTIDFQTPGVILRQAASDPLLSHATHLIIDEVHERNADMDLLLALAKRAQRQRRHHPTLPPLKLIIMSATLDASHWEKYFCSDSSTGDAHDDGNENNKNIDFPKTSIAKVEVPDSTRFPIKILHYGDPDFPRIQNMSPRKKKKSSHRLSDEELCEAAADLAVHIYTTQRLEDGSILCFLPGMDEIRMVNEIIQRKFDQKGVKVSGSRPKILILHSSVSSKNQSLVFKPGPKVILSTNIAETSVTIPDVKFVIDPGRERQSSLLDSGGNDLNGEDEDEDADVSLSFNPTIVGSQLITVDIAQSSAKQRAGRAGRVSPGTCYRLYTKDQHTAFPLYTKPEMLRMDLSQLVLHSISLCDNPHSENSDPLGLISGAPDPPPLLKLRQAVYNLLEQSLVAVHDIGERSPGEGGGVGNDDSGDPVHDSDEQLNDNEDSTFIGFVADKDFLLRPHLTELGKAVSSLPATPRIGRMLVLGLAIGAIEPALTIAALLSVPKVFQSRSSRQSLKKESTSDIMAKVEVFEYYQNQKPEVRQRHPQHIEFRQVAKVRRQLADNIRDLIALNSSEFYKGANDLTNWNHNGNRFGAQAALICAVSQHIAHLVNGQFDFATRDLDGGVRIHPSSVNFDNSVRAHWYVYNELRSTSNPYLHVTTAVSPLELALFSSGSAHHSLALDDDIKLLQERLGWMHVADQWVPVDAAVLGHGKTLVRLMTILKEEMQNDVAQDPIAFQQNETYKRLVYYVLSAIEQQRQKL